MRVIAAIERWPLREPFTIARGSKSEAIVVTVRIEDGDHVGRGEALPYARFGEDPAGVLAQIDAYRVSSREALRELPAGAARNALDAALWDLEAKRSGVPVWRRLGREPAPVVTAYTLPIRDLHETRLCARREKHRPLLKVKAGSDEDLARIEAVREEAPDARLIVDANEGWTRKALDAWSTRLGELGVSLIEQPLPASHDRELDGYDSVPLCADESFHGDAIEELVGRYRAVNIKLDKQGGLTFAIEAMQRARALGLDVMIGSMVSTSLAVAPAVLLAQDAEYADLDGPLFLSRDREPALRFEGSLLHPPQKELWG